ncbi:MAG: CDP-glycerol glycerophosphotransferase family protein [Anaerovoracaceae bacterium]
MNLFRKIRSLISAMCFIIFNRICCIFIPLAENQVCFLAETHKELNGNLEAVHNYLEINKPELDLLVYAKGDRRERHNIVAVLEIWKAISVSKYIFLDDLYTTTSYMKVRTNQEIIQLWHGAGAYKKFGHSRNDLYANIGGKMRVHKGYKKYTKAIVSGSRIAWCYAEAFGIDEKKVYATGMPRMDRLFDSQYVESIKENFLTEYPLLKDKKIILFAPTYRGTLVREADYNFEEANLNKLSSVLGDEYVILTRWHPALKNNIKRGLSKVKYCDFGDRIIDFTEYKNVNDLLIACDIMITDYSSIIFDYFPLHKPVVYFAYDRDEYSGGRGLYYDFDKYLFGNVAEDFNQLVKSVKDENLCEEQRKDFYDLFLDRCDGNSTERVCDLIWNMD